MRKMQAIARGNVEKKADTQASSRTPFETMDRLIRSLSWPEGVTLGSRKVHRVWAGKRGRIAAEFRLKMTRNGTPAEYFLQGVFAKQNPGLSKSRTRPRIQRGIIMDACLAADDAGCWITSPNRDPEFPFAQWFFTPKSQARDKLRFVDSSGVNLVDAWPEQTTKLIAYRAGRRFVVRVRPAAKEPGIFLKAFRRPPPPARLAKAARFSTWLTQRSDGRMRSPEQVRINSAIGLVAYREIWPAPAPIRYSAEDRASAATMLRCIHEFPLDDESPHTPADELQTVHRWVVALETLRLTYPLLLLQGTEALRRTQPDFRAEQCCLLHRDFYHSQLLRNDEGLWLTDWDTFCAGHRELDVATYLAHAVLDNAMAGRETDLDADISVFLDGYGDSLLDRTRLNWYLGGALLRLAAMHVARGYGLEALRPLWEEASKRAGIA